MNKILLIQQYLGDNSEVGPIFPIGLAYISTAISKLKWDIQVLDMNIYEDPFLILSNILSEFNPDVIGISLRNIDNVDLKRFRYFYEDFVKLLNFIAHKQAIIIVGGAGFSIFANQIMQENTSINYGIVQEGETTIVELLSAINSRKEVHNIKGILFRANNEIIYTGQRKPLDFSNSDIPDRSLFNVKAYDEPLCIGVQTKRGCSLKCSYCTYPFLNSYSERFRPAKNVVDEIESLINDYNISEIIFCDDIFNVPKWHAESIIHEMINRKIHIKWSAWFDIANTDESFIKLAVQSGCYRMCFSAEAITNDSLKALHKNFNVEQIYSLMNIIKKNEYKNIDFRFSIFALPPKQSLKGMLDTLSFTFRNHVMHKNIKCLVSWIRVYPNTELYGSLKYKPKNLLPTPNGNIDLSTIFFNEYHFNTILIRIYNWMFLLFEKLRKLKRKYIWNRINKI